MAAGVGPGAHERATARPDARGLGRRRRERLGTMDAIQMLEQKQTVVRPAMQPGDTVKVHVRVKEGDKERIQIFEGIVIAQRRGGTRASFTVRKVSFSQGVERIFPLHSPIIQKIEVLRSAKVRRAKLFYLRDLKGKAARMKEVRKDVRKAPQA